MKAQPAYDAITLAHGGNTVCLRASLRAATNLERMHDGYPELFKRIEQFDSRTVYAVISATATDLKAAERYIRSYAKQPLHALKEAIYGPILILCMALMPRGDDAYAGSSTATPRKPVAWADAYADLYQIGTGWLGWTPETTWNATPTEISDAFKGHVAMLKAVHGASDDDDSNGNTNTPEQRAANVANGLDPDFDRAGLRALSASYG